MKSESVSLNLYSPPAMSRPSTSSPNLLGIALGMPQEGSFSSYDGSSQLFYENYGASTFQASEYGSSWQKNDRNGQLPCCAWSASDPSIRPHSSYVLAGANTSLLPGNVDFNAHPPPQPHPPRSTLVRDLSPADPGTDYMERISPISAEDPLSPLSLYQDQLPLDPLQPGLLPNNMKIPRKWIYDRPHALQSEDDEQLSPERRPYHPLHDIHHQGLDKWAMSPDSVDTDLDDESVLSSSTSSLSPPFSESDLRHFADSEEYNDDDYDDRCFSHVVSTPGCSFCKLSRSPTQTKTDSYFFSPTPSTAQNLPSDLNPRTMIDVYQPIEQYPSHITHLYTSTEQQCHPQTELPYQQNERTEQSISPMSTSPQFPTEEWQTPNLLSSGPDTTIHELSPAVPFSDNSSLFSPFQEDSGISADSIPCSPSLRRLTELPSLEDEFPIQNVSHSYNEDAHFQSYASPEPRRRAQWLSLPGADTDDDLIPEDLASKNYIPDPTATVSSSHNGNLLIWNLAPPRIPPSDHIQDDEPAPPRSPSPENLNLDSATISELAPEGEVEEARRLYELRQKTQKHDKWERERCRELSALLRLKLKLAERGEISSGTEQEVQEVKERKEMLLGEESNSPMEKGKRKNPEGQPSDLAPFSSSIPALPAETTRRSKSLPTPASSVMLIGATASPKGKSAKPAKIVSMDQLVAKMVFHRQQDSLKRSPTRTRQNIMQRTQHQTPRSPLRQVSLPQDSEEDQKVDGLNEHVDVVDGRMPSDFNYCLSPTTSPLLCESPLTLSMEFDPIPMDGQEHVSNRFRMTV